MARRIGAEPLDPPTVGLEPRLARRDAALVLHPPEADIVGDGDRLGPVGGRIVGEVLVGIVDADPESFRAVDPGWRPSLPAPRAGRFGLSDLLAFSAEVAEAAA